MLRFIALLLLTITASTGWAGTYALEEIVQIPTPDRSMYPTLSPEGSRVAFAAPGKEQGWDLFVAKLGEAPKRVLEGLASGPDTWANALLAHPWSADGNRIALLTVEDENKNGQRDRDELVVVQVLDLASGRLTRVSSPGQSGLNPAFWPTGERICYTETGKQKQDPTQVICRDGLTAPPRVLQRFERAFVYWLLPSPDGRYLALRRIRAGDPQPHLVVLDGSSGKVLLDVAGRSPASGSVPPRWRADSQAIYVADLDLNDLPDVLRVALPSGNVESLGVGGCASFLAGPDNGLLLASPRRTLPALERTVDLSSYDISGRTRYRIQSNLHATSLSGDRLAALSTDSGQIIVARLRPLGEPDGPDPGTAEVLQAERIRRTTFRIAELASMFAVYQIEHSSYPKGDDPMGTLQRAMPAREPPMDGRSRPFKVSVARDGKSYQLHSEPFGYWFVEYRSELGRPVVKSSRPQ